MAKNNHYTEAQVAWVRSHYQRMTVSQMLPLFNEKFSDNRGYDGLKSMILHRGIRADRPAIHPRNAGQFKAGEDPANTKPLGHERICAKDGYILVKVAEPNPYTGAPTRYRFKQHLVWEAATGPIPAGHLLTFIDDNKLNCALDNLELITKAENCRRNKMQYMQSPQPIRGSIKAMAKLVTAIHQPQPNQRKP